NDAHRTFTDTTSSARLDARTHAVAIAPTDFDNRRDIDLVIVNADAPPLLFKNLRDGTFRDAAGDGGLAAVARSGDEITGVTVADVNKDDFPDFFFVRDSGGTFALSDGRGGFRIEAGPDRARGARAAQFVDYDNDGLLDLLSWSADGPHLFRNVGMKWNDVTATALRGADPSTARPEPVEGRALRAGTSVGPAFAPRTAHALAVADVDRDGWTDVVISTPSGPIVWRNSGAVGRRSIAVQLAGVVSNRSA